MRGKVSDPLFVLYDGDCGLCSRTAQALRLLDGRGRLRVLPLQLATAELGDAAPSVAAMTVSLHAGIPGRGWSTGGEAAMRIARAIPVLRSLAVVGSLPQPCSRVNTARKSPWNTACVAKRASTAPSAV